MNQQQAVRAISKVESGEVLTDQETNRMVVCGSCDEMSGTKDRAKAAFRSLVSGLFAKIERYDEWGNDPELMNIHKQEKHKRRRIRHAHEIKAKGHIYRIEKRIEQLRRRHESDSEEGN